MPSKAAQSIINAVYAVWKRMGIPENMQVDNEVAFFGSPAYPRGMGPLIRLCLHYGVNLWFIPPSEPRQESLAFEHRHNNTYRYSKIKGKTPFKALASADRKLLFPTGDNAPQYPLDKPVEGCYHFVRFIRSDQRLNIFGETFPVPPETQYEYVVATVDVKDQKLKLFLDQVQLEEYNYKLR